MNRHKKAAKNSILILTILFLIGFSSILVLASPDSVKSWYKDPFAIREFVNSKSSSEGFTPIPDEYNGAGALNYDPVSAEKICNLAGYFYVDSYDCVSIYEGRCGWDSCSDNYLALWSPSKNNFEIKNACNAGNKWISSLTCSRPYECYEDSDCGEDYSSEDKCYQGNVIKEVHEFECGDHECSETTTNEIVETCDNGCDNGKCITPHKCSDGIDNDQDGFIDMNDPGCSSPNDEDEIDCYNNLDCGRDSCAGGDNYCENGDIYQDYRIFTCNNPGKNSASCSNEVSPKQIEDCGDSYYEYKERICRNSTVYQKVIYHSKGCSETTDECFYEKYPSEKFVANCIYGCDNGKCLLSNCEDKDFDNYDSCNPGEVGDDGKPKDCNDNNSSIHPGATDICNGVDDNCDSQIDEGDVCITECNDSIDNDADLLIDAADPGCWDDINNPLTYNPQNDEEGRATIICFSKTDCGTDSFTGAKFCTNGDVYQEYQEFTCNNPGLGSSGCSSNISSKLVEDCKYGCSEGKCKKKSYDNKGKYIKMEEEDEPQLKKYSQMNYTYINETLQTIELTKGTLVVAEETADNSRLYFVILIAGILIVILVVLIILLASG